MVNLIMACVSSVKYKIRFNSMETDFLPPLEVSAKEILYHRIYFSFVQKPYQVCWTKQKMMKI
jgi:hypothetical protein